MVMEISPTKKAMCITVWLLGIGLVAYADWRIILGLAMIKFSYEYAEETEKQAKHEKLMRQTEELKEKYANIGNMYSDEDCEHYSKMCPDPKWSENVSKRWLGWARKWDAEKKKQEGKIKVPTLKRLQEGEIKGNKPLIVSGCGRMTISAVKPSTDIMFEIYDGDILVESFPAEANKVTERTSERVFQNGLYFSWKPLNAKIEFVEATYE